MEKEAFDALIAKRKMAEQRKTLYELITYSWGKEAWTELVQMERDIRAERKKQIHARQELKQKIADVIFLVIGGAVIIGMIIGFLWILSLGGS